MLHMLDPMILGATTVGPFLWLSVTIKSTLVILGTPEFLFILSNFCLFEDRIRPIIFSDGSLFRTDCKSDQPCWYHYRFISWSPGWSGHAKSSLRPKAYPLDDGDLFSPSKVAGCCCCLHLSFHRYVWSKQGDSTIFFFLSMTNQHVPWTCFANLLRFFIVIHLFSPDPFFSPRQKQR